MNTYQGRREYGVAAVYKNGWPLDPSKSLQFRNHSPTGFNWGYGGSGPAQLALALLLEETTEDEALDLYQLFKFEVVANFAFEGWHLTSSKIRQWLDERRKTRQKTHAKSAALDD